MITFLTQLIRWVNLPYTILLGTLGAYWITVILGFLDIEVLDEVFGFDFDVDIELDGEFSMGNVLSILNFGAVPVSIWLTVFALQMWIYSLLFNIIVDGISPQFPNLFRFLLCALLFIPLSVMLTRVLTSPLKDAFEGRIISKKDCVGKECLIISSRVDQTFGLAEVNLDGAPQNIDVRAKPEDNLKKGDKALIYTYDEEQDIFYVTSVSNV